MLHLTDPKKNKTEKEWGIRFFTKALYSEFDETVASKKKDYDDVYKAYWEERIAAGKATLSVFQKLWKNDHFDADQVKALVDSELFEELKGKYGEACVKKIVLQYFNDICTEIFKGSK